MTETNVVVCYFCRKPFLTTAQYLEDFGAFYNLNSNACAEFVCKDCDNDKNFTYDADRDTYIVCEHLYHDASDKRYCVDCGKKL